VGVTGGFIVRGIAARDDPLGDRDQFGGSQQLLQPGTRGGINQRVKIRAGQDLGKLLLGTCDLSRPPRNATISMDLRFRAALTTTLVSRTIPIQVAARLPSAPFLINRWMSSSVRRAALTRARDARRPGIGSPGSFVIVTRSSGSRHIRSVGHSYQGAGVVEGFRAVIFARGGMLSGAIS
jgi:hypothetical protein